jgi:hypothetical protein
MLKLDMPVRQRGVSKSRSSSPPKAKPQESKDYSKGAEEVLKNIDPIKSTIEQGIDIELTHDNPTEKLKKDGGRKKTRKSKKSVHKTRRSKKVNGRK